MEKRKLKIALIGRPNVGKSTLFNRLVQKSKAIVDNIPGVTRDRIYGDVDWEGIPFVVIDTGGFLPPEEESILPQVVVQCEKAIEEADVIILVTDARTGPTPVDQELVRRLRELQKPFLVAVNKIDSDKQIPLIYDFYSLGTKTLWPISAIHGHGVYELFNEALRLAPRIDWDESEETECPDSTIKVALVGRPNVGKSSLFNQLIGDARSVVSDIPGTTRDTINTLVRHQQREYLFMDTAGLRKKARIKGRLERYSVQRSLRAIRGADITLILIEAPEGMTDQDIRIINYALEQGKCVFIGVNKWDLMPSAARYEIEYIEAIKSRLRFAPFIPIITLSALQGEGLDKVFLWIDNLYQEYTHRIPTGRLNRFLEEVYAYYQPPFYKNRPVKLYYITQVGIKPPTFVIFTNYPQGIAENYKRYLIKKMRQIGFKHVNLRLIFRERRRK